MPVAPTHRAVAKPGRLKRGFSQTTINDARLRIRGAAALLRKAQEDIDKIADAHPRKAVVTRKIKLALAEVEQAEAAAGKE